MWMVRAGEGAAGIDDSLSQGIVSIGWLYNQDLGTVGYQFDHEDWAVGLVIEQAELFASTEARNVG